MDNSRLYAGKHTALGAVIGQPLTLSQQGQGLDGRTNASLRDPILARTKANCSRRGRTTGCRRTRPRQLDDFSASILPLALPPAVRAAIANADARAYPDPACTFLRKAIAAQHELKPENVLCANGSVALIQAIARACLRTDDTALIVGPTFGEYASAVRSVGANVAEIQTTKPEDVLRAIAEHRPALVFL